MARPKRAKRIFVSHAHADKLLVDALVDLIGTGVGIPSEEVFCTALEGLGIPAGSNFIDYIKAQIQKPEVVLLLITDNYLKRPFCLARWVRPGQCHIRLSPSLVARLGQAT
jgi:hypothetical protein